MYIRQVEFGENQMKRIYGLLLITFLFISSFFNANITFASDQTTAGMEYVEVCNVSKVYSCRWCASYP
jgi:hypothetical protein